MSDKVDAPVKNFPMVCIGGSAGGPDAYIRLLQNLPADMGGNRHRELHHHHADLAS